MDLATARLEVRERIGELAADEDFFSDEEVDRAINEAVRRFSAEERWPWLLTEGTGSLSADDDEMELPDGVSVNRFLVLYANRDADGTPIPLERVSPTHGMRLRHNFLRRDGHPRWYYVTSATVEIGDVRYIVRFVPAADDSFELGYLYYRVPDALSSGSDDIDVPEEYVDAVPAWAAGKLFLKEFAISQKASEQFAVYAGILEQARAEVQSAGPDEVLAWGREHPGELRVMGEHDYVMGRVPGSLGF
jgi:hypothetical protein